jgi:hypothetical protein
MIPAAKMDSAAEPALTTKKRPALFQRARLFRKRLVIPAEHGSWSWLLVPFFVGVLVAGRWNLAVTLVLLGGMAGFLLRQPLTIWLRIRAGQGRKKDGPPAAAWTVGLAVVALVCFVGLVALGLAAILWLLVPIAAIFTLYLLAVLQRRANSRTLWNEVAGAAGLAATAPAAYIAASGRLDAVAWLLWGLMAGQNGLGVLYVRLRIADTHGRSMGRRPILLAHALVLAAAGILAFIGQTPWLAVVPFAAYFLRAAWAVAGRRPVANIKRFGFSEVGVEILGGLLIAAGWLL